MLSTVSVSAAVWAYVDELLAQKGLTQHELAATLGRTQASVSQILSGKRRRAQLDLLSAVAQHFGLLLSDVIREAEQRDLLGQTGTPSSAVPQGGAANERAADASRIRDLEDRLAEYERYIEELNVVTTVIQAGVS
jgi:transcriptional regulator with XRE-family HTH domain